MTSNYFESVSRLKARTYSKCNEGSFIDRVKILSTFFDILDGFTKNEIEDLFEKKTV